MGGRRIWLGLAISLGLHVALAASFAGVAVFRGWQAARAVDIELTSTSTAEAERLPFGPPPPPPGAARKAAAARRARAHSASEGVKIAMADAGPPDAGVGASDAGDGGAHDASTDARGDGGSPDGRDGGVRRPSDGRMAGPAGSRLTALLRLDRLRTVPDAPATIAAVDGLLRHLPDRRRLLDGTGLDLYRDFDALFIATPNPLDDAVTFLVVRHRLPEEQLMAALGRGAEAAGRPIVWRNEGGRPIGVRSARRSEGDAGVQRLLVERDDRIFVLPQRGLVVMAPPAYATALLGRRAGAAVDAGPQRPPELRWKELVASIDAEDGAMPDDAILMMTASQLVGGRRRGGGPELPATGPNGLPLPQYLTLFAGAPAGAFLELIGQFERDADAASWITAWPGWKQTLLGSPLLLLSGFSPIVARADMRQEDNAVILRTTGSGIELRRVLGTIGNLIGGGRR